MLNGCAPYKALLTHGFVVDGEGKKMSKSKGNVVAPQKVSDTLGAEILRLWVAATDYSGELSISDEILKRVVESYRRIRNTLRFLLANTSDFNPSADAVAIDQLLEIDRHAIARMHQLQDEIRVLGGGTALQVGHGGRGQSDVCRMHVEGVHGTAAQFRHLRVPKCRQLVETTEIGRAHV